MNIEKNIDFVKFRLSRELSLRPSKFVPSCSRSIYGVRHKEVAFMKSVVAENERCLEIQKFLSLKEKFSVQFRGSTLVKMSSRVIHGIHAGDIMVNCKEVRNIKFV